MLSFNERTFQGRKARGKSRQESWSYLDFRYNMVDLEFQEVKKLEICWSC